MVDGDADKAGEKGEKDIKDGEGVSQTPAFGAGMGFDPSVAGGFPGMGFGGDMSQMMQMMAMQNGMGSGGFGNFPMMGMFSLGQFNTELKLTVLKVCLGWAWTQCRCRMR